MDVDDPATDSFKRELGFSGLPTIVLLDAEGEIVRHWSGLIPRDTFVDAFETLGW